MLNAAYYPQLRAVLLEIEALLAGWDPDAEHRRLLQRCLGKLRQDFLADKIFPAMVVPTLAWRALGHAETPALYVLNAAHFMFYAFLDLTDDVEDGELSGPFWHQQGAAVATNAGTSLLFGSLMLLDRLGRHRVRASRIEALRAMFIEAGWFLTIGQHRDLVSARAGRLKYQDVLTTHRLKTGTSVALYLASAARLAGAGTRQMRQFEALGRQIGLMVQIIGDWRNLQAGHSSDLANHCQSLPLVLLRERLNAADAEQLDAIWSGAGRPGTDLGANLALRHLLAKYRIDEPLNQLLAHSRNLALEQVEWLRRGGCHSAELLGFVQRFEPVESL